jgi:hypothetical protein
MILTGGKQLLGENLELVPPGTDVSPSTSVFLIWLVFRLKFLKSDLKFFHFRQEAGSRSVCGHSVYPRL